MSKEQEVKEITNELYKAYGSDSGYLLGLESKYHDTVQVIIRFTLDYNKLEDKIKLLEKENKAYRLWDEWFGWKANWINWKTR